MRATAPPVPDWLANRRGWIRRCPLLRVPRPGSWLRCRAECRTAQRPSPRSQASLRAHAAHRWPRTDSRRTLASSAPPRSTSRTRHCRAVHTERDGVVQTVHAARGLTLGVAKVARRAARACAACGPAPSPSTPVTGRAVGDVEGSGSASDRVHAWALPECGRLAINSCCRSRARAADPGTVCLAWISVRSCSACRAKASRLALRGRARTMSLDLAGKFDLLGILPGLTTLPACTNCGYSTDT